MGVPIAEIFVAVAHFIFTGGAWSVGHFFFLLSGKCQETGFTGCSSSDPIGFLFMMVSSVLFFFIARHVLNFLYKGELPGGEELSKRFSQMTNATNQGKKKRK